MAAASTGRLKLDMPLEGTGARKAEHGHLEAFARFLVGAAPALELHTTMPEDARIAAWISDARSAIDQITRPGAPSRLNFNQGTQPLVDAAFLAQALMRAPKALWHGLAQEVQGHVIECLRSTREIRPHFNNWLLFSAVIESFFCVIGEPWDRMRVDYALRQHQQWYVGDGCYSDGPVFHWDYYNSIVIHPLLLDTLTGVKGQHSDWDKLQAPVLARAQRHAELLERMIGPDGTFALVGRSLAYRGGVFHLLAQLALNDQLPASLTRGQVRGALAAVTERTLGGARNYDDKGWLRIGISAHQPSVGEGYVCTGSLYLASLPFLPLGLPVSHPYWTEAAQPWSQRAAFWLEQDLTADQAR